MDPLEALINSSAEIESKIGYVFRDKNLLAMAFVHCSYVNENRIITTRHNERLEFLGDSVLGLLSAEYLYKELPQTPEGELTHLRARLVESSACFQYTLQLGVEGFLLLGKGEKRNGGRGRESILADLFEAIIGAIYLDGGLEAAKDFFFGPFSIQIKEILEQPLRNWKADLQDYSQRKYQSQPSYQLTSQTGPDHSKQFTIEVVINQQTLGTGTGPSKKEAQQSAAEDAMKHIESKASE